MTNVTSAAEETASGRAIITVLGSDRPGIVAAVAGALAAALPERCFRKLCTTESGEAMESAKPFYERGDKR